MSVKQLWSLPLFFKRSRKLITCIAPSPILPYEKHVKFTLYSVRHVLDLSSYPLLYKAAVLSILCVYVEQFISLNSILFGTCLLAICTDLQWFSSTNVTVRSCNRVDKSFSDCYLLYGINLKLHGYLIIQPYFF
jgi:hypothetical protein